MISSVLKRLEMFPDFVIRQNDNLFEQLNKSGLLDYIQPNPYHQSYPCPYSLCSEGCDMEVVDMKGTLYAICANDPEIDPVTVDRELLHQYRFSMYKFLGLLKTANDISGKIEKISSDGYYLGGKKYGDQSIGFVFVRNVDALQLSGIKSVCDEEKVVMLTPTTKIDKLDIAGRDILNATLIDSLRDDYRLELDLRSLNVQSTKLIILDDKSSGRSYFVEFNGDKCSVPYAKFVLLLFMVFKLKKDGMGWVNTDMVDKEGIIESDNDINHLYRLISELTKCLKQCNNLIKNDGAGNYRLNIPLRNISYPSEQWLCDTYYVVLKAVERERERRKKQKKERLTLEK